MVVKQIQKVQVHSSNLTLPYSNSSLILSNGQKSISWQSINRKWLENICEQPLKRLYNSDMILLETHPARIDNSFPDYIVHLPIYIYDHIPIPKPRARNNHKYSSQSFHDRHDDDEDMTVLSYQNQNQSYIVCIFSLLLLLILLPPQFYFFVYFNVFVLFYFWFYCLLYKGFNTSSAICKV